MAIEVLAWWPSWIFRKISKWPKWQFGQKLIALGFEIELRFALQLTVAEINAIEVLAVAAILDFLQHLKMAQMAFWAIAHCPRGRNRAPFCSTIDGFRDNGNQKLAKTLKYATLERNSGINTICILFPLVLAIHLDHKLRTAVPDLEILSSTGQKIPLKAI